VRCGGAIGLGATVGWVPAVSVSAGWSAQPGNEISSPLMITSSPVRAPLEALVAGTITVLVCSRPPALEPAKDQLWTT
jgi:hypothetical protein